MPDLSCNDCADAANPSGLPIAKPEKKLEDVIVDDADPLGEDPDTDVENDGFSGKDPFTDDFVGKDPNAEDDGFTGKEEDTTNFAGKDPEDDNKYSDFNHTVDDPFNVKNPLYYEEFDSKDTVDKTEEFTDTSSDEEFTDKNLDAVDDNLKEDLDYYTLIGKDSTRTNKYGITDFIEEDTIPIEDEKTEPTTNSSTWTNIRDQTEFTELSDDEESVATSDDDSGTDLEQDFIESIVEDAPESIIDLIESAPLEVTFSSIETIPETQFESNWEEFIPQFNDSDYAVSPEVDLYSGLQVELPTQFTNNFPELITESVAQEIDYDIKPATNWELTTQYGEFAYRSAKGSGAFYVRSGLDNELAQDTEEFVYKIDDFGYIVSSKEDMAEYEAYKSLDSADFFAEMQPDADTEIMSAYNSFDATYELDLAFTQLPSDLILNLQAVTSRGIYR